MFSVAPISCYMVYHNTNQNSHVGRNHHCLFVLRAHTTYGKNNHYYKGTPIWNSLNASLYAAATLAQFKTFTYVSTNSTCMHVNVLLANMCSYIIIVHLGHR